MPTASVIIPSFNHARHVGRALESLRAQTLRDWEAVVIDDGSTDNTRQIIASFVSEDSRIRYYYQPNSGLAAARNSGLEKAQGRYVQFLDADDRIEPGKLEFQSRYLEEHGDVDIVYGDVRFFTPQDPDARLLLDPLDPTGWTQPGYSGRGTEILKRLVERCIMYVPAPLMRKRLIDAVGGFSGDLFSVEDWDYWIRCASHGAMFQYVSRPGAGALYNCEASSMCRSEDRVMRSVARLRRKINRTIKDAEALRLNRQLIATEEGYTGIRQVREGALLSGMRQLIKAGWWSPDARGRAKWLYGAAIAPFVARHRFEELVTSPLEFRK